MGSSEHEIWRPLSVRGDLGKHVQYDALHGGIPSWLAESLWAWVVSIAGNAHGQPIRNVFQHAERALRRNFPTSSALTSMRPEFEEDSEKYLEFVDFLCAYHCATHQISELRDLLSDAGSVWQPMRADRASRTQLVRRVDEPTQSAAEAVMAVEDAASRHLREAWVDVYGRSPDPSDGYSRAVKAVESAASPVVLPTDPLATLGKIINAVLDKPSKWTVALGDDKKGDRVEAIARMCHMLWTGQHDRHGVADASKQPVSQEEAEHAVHLAVALVRMFRSGFVRKAGV